MAAEWRYPRDPLAPLRLRVMRRQGAIPDDSIAV